MVPSADKPAIKGSLLSLGWVQVYYSLPSLPDASISTIQTFTFLVYSTIVFLNPLHFWPVLSVANAVSHAQRMKTVTLFIIKVINAENHNCSLCCKSLKMFTHTHTHLHTHTSMCAHTWRGTTVRYAKCKICFTFLFKF